MTAWCNVEARFSSAEQRHGSSVSSHEQVCCAAGTAIDHFSKDPKLTTCHSKARHNVTNRSVAPFGAEKLSVESESFSGANDRTQISMKSIRCKKVHFSAEINRRQRSWTEEEPITHDGWPRNFLKGMGTRSYHKKAEPPSVTRANPSFSKLLLPVCRFRRHVRHARP